MVYLNWLPLPIALSQCACVHVQHEGALDGDQSSSAASVVALFAGLCRNRARDELLEQLQEVFSSVLQLEVMAGDAEGQVGTHARTHAYATSSPCYATPCLKPGFQVWRGAAMGTYLDRPPQRAS